MGEQILAYLVQPWHDFTSMTWVCVWYVACGGILVGMVIKHVSALMKDITLGFSILLAAAGSMFLFEDVTLNATFTGGAGLVVFSVLLYGSPLKSAWDGAVARILSVCGCGGGDELERGRYSAVSTSEQGVEGEGGEKE